MAIIEKLDKLNMTPLENALKHCMELRPDIAGKILTSAELSEYMLWMVENFGQQSSISIDNVPSIATSSGVAELAERILSDPNDRQAVELLFSGNSEQSEDRYISLSHDISVSRMYRYMPAHWHTNKYFEIYYSFSGDCPVHFANEVVTVKPGTVLVVAPSVVHANPCYSDDCSLLYCWVRSSTFDKVFWNLLPPENLMSTFFRKALSGDQPTAYVQFDTEKDEEVRHLMMQIYTEFQKNQTYGVQMMNALMSAFFIHVLRNYEGTARLPRTEDFFWKHQFSAIFSYIQLHYAHTSLPEVAARFHYSERQISRIILNCTGKNYAQTVLQLRMEKAASLLKQRELPINAISEEVGYSTLSSFYRTFSNYYGCTPAAYQKSVEVQLTE